MYKIEAYDAKKDCWTLVKSVDDEKAGDQYKKMLSDERAKTGLRLIDPNGHTSRLCHQ